MSATANYFGPALNRVARLLGIGHGGQILLSGVTRDLSRAHLGDGAVLVDLDSHRLQDLTEAKHSVATQRRGIADEVSPTRPSAAFFGSSASVRCSILFRINLPAWFPEGGAPVGAAIGPSLHGENVGVWAYPQGGTPQQSVLVKSLYMLFGVTVSVAPSR